jgi:hypothetical protein
MTKWEVLDPWLPWIHIWRLESRLKPEPPSAGEIEALSKNLKKQERASLAASEAASLVAAETSRIDGLERKLDAQRTIVTALAPFTIAAIAWAMGQLAPAPLILAGAALGYLTASYLVAMRGAAVSPRFTMSASDFTGLVKAGAPAGRDGIATRLEYARANERYGVRLANYIWATQRSVIIAAILTGVATVLLLSSSGSAGQTRPAISAPSQTAPYSSPASPSRT